MSDNIFSVPYHNGKNGTHNTRLVSRRKNRMIRSRKIDDMTKLNGVKTLKYGYEPVRLVLDGTFIYL